ncbi:MAG: DUF2934 domain-containing protein [Rhodocyclaceae bacterium]|nr:DUF2934 domain-containing protein [Rhodocyclaceae bacterium]
MNAIKRNTRAISAQLPQPQAALPPASPVVGRDEAVSRAAYFLAEKRGFTPGAELQDWLLAEALVVGETSDL